jgi:hypothetical protein
MISGRVASLARFIMAITSAFLLVRSPFVWLACFLALRAFGLRRLGHRLAGILAIDSVFAHLNFSLTGLRSSQ